MRTDVRGFRLPCSPRTLALHPRWIILPSRRSQKGRDHSRPSVLHDDRGRGAYAPINNFSRAIFSFHTSGASWWTLLPSASTATVTGKSLTSNS